MKLQGEKEQEIIFRLTETKSIIQKIHRQPFFVDIRRYYLYEIANDTDSEETKKKHDFFFIFLIEKWKLTFSWMEVKKIK